MTRRERLELRQIEAHLTAADPHLAWIMGAFGPRLLDEAGGAAERWPGRPRRNRARATDARAYDPAAVNAPAAIRGGSYRAGLHASGVMTAVVLFLSTFVSVFVR